MRKALVVLAAVCVSTGGILACNQKSTDKPVSHPNPVPDTQPSLGWSIKLKSRCDSPTGTPMDELERETPCLAEHGFTVHSDGRYQLGPGPDSEIRNGNVLTEELNNLSAALAGLLPSPDLGEENHQQVDATDGDNTVTLNSENGPENVLLRVAGSDLSYKVRKPEDAKAIYISIRNLAEKYYRAPFPDDCLDHAVADTMKLFSSLQTCSNDSDCIYLNADLEPVSATDRSLSVITDDCTLLRGLPVANEASLKSQRNRLEELYNRTGESCGPRIYRENCTMSQFQMNGSMPTCRQGMCALTQSNPIGSS